MNLEEFSCAECGKRVVPKTGPGRTREYVRGCRLPIPDDFPIPTCTGCGETYMTAEISAKLDALLREKYLLLQSDHYRRLVSILVRRHGVTQKDIIRTCQVTPSYLSHVLAGKKQASTTLTRLLEAFVACPSEFKRHLEEIPWSMPRQPSPVRRPTREAQWGAVVDLDHARRARWSWQPTSTVPANMNSDEAGAA